MLCQLLGEVHRQFYASYDSDHTEELTRHRTGKLISSRPYDVKVSDNQRMYKPVLRRLKIANYSPNAPANIRRRPHPFLQRHTARYATRNDRDMEGRAHVW